MKLKFVVIIAALIQSLGAHATELRTLKEFSIQGQTFPASEKENKEIYCLMGVGDLQGKFRPKDESDELYEADTVPAGTIFKVQSVSSIKFSRSTVVRLDSETEKAQIVIHCKPRQVELFSETTPPDLKDILDLFLDKDLSY